MKNTLTSYFTVAGIIFLVSGLGIYQYRSTRSEVPVVGQVETEKTSSLTTSQFLKEGRLPSFVSGVMEPGNIRLELSPEGFDNGQLKVRFFANAHDLILNPYDLALMTTLEYGSRRLKPSYSDRMKGHHDSGLMFFEIGKLHNPTTLSPFSITVSGLPSEEVRVFKWK